MAYITGALAIATGAGWLWYITKGPGAIVHALRRLWLDLPGAAPAGELIAVHHGTQPIWVRCGRRSDELTLSIHTPLPTSAIAFRLWPKTLDVPPPLGPFGQAHGGPPVERAVLLEMRFANTLNVESSDEAAADRLISEEVALGVLKALDRAPRGFAGVSYDGQNLGVYFKGPIATDPDQATAVARLVWSTLT